MDKFKKYLKYALLLVLLFIFVSIMSKLIIISMYKPKECKVLFENPKIEIIDSKATNANGYIYGLKNLYNKYYRKHNRKQIY